MKLICACGLVLAGTVSGCTDKDFKFNLFGDSKKAKHPDPPDDEADQTSDENAELTYTRLNDRHYLTKVLDEGGLLILEDGSVWNVPAADRIYSAGWRVYDEIRVMDITSAPHYQLVNKPNREKVIALYTGTPQ